MYVHEPCEQVSMYIIIRIYMQYVYCNNNNILLLQTNWQLCSDNTLLNSQGLLKYFKTALIMNQKLCTLEHT